MQADDWIELLLVATPVLALVYRQCLRMGFRPWLPILGLAAGLLLEQQR